MLAAPSPAEAQESHGTGAILGHVVDSRTGAPLRNCQARLRGPVRVVYSDSTGNFRIDDLPAGHYWLDLRVSFHAPQLIPVTVDEGVANRMQVRMVQNSHQPFVEIPRRDPTPIPPPAAMRGGVLVVTVRDTTGHRVPGVGVVIEGAGNAASSGPFANMHGRTDSTGVCRLSPVRPGRRAVSVGSVVHVTSFDTLTFAPDREVYLTKTVRLRAWVIGYKVVLERDGSASVDHGDAIYYYDPDGHMSAVGDRFPGAIRYAPEETKSKH